MAEAFAIGAAYKSELTRYERQQILFRTAVALDARKDEISDLITLETGLCKKDSLYEVGRAYDVFMLAGQMCIQDDSQVFSCDLTPHGKTTKNIHLASAFEGDFCHYAIQPSTQYGGS